MTKKLFALLLAVLGTFALSGCVTVSPGGDPVVVNAERSLQISFESVDVFLRIEHRHREWTAANLPHVHVLAENLRKNAPEAFRQASQAVREYKRNRTSAERQKVQERVGDVQQLGAQATTGLSEINP